MVDDDTRVDTKADLEKIVLIAFSNPSQAQYVEAIARQQGYSPQRFDTSAELLAEIERLESINAHYKIIMEPAASRYATHIGPASQVNNALKETGKNPQQILRAVTQYSEMENKCGEENPGIKCIYGYTNDNEFRKFLD